MSQRRVQRKVKLWLYLKKSGEYSFLDFEPEYLLDYDSKFVPMQVVFEAARAGKRKRGE